MKLFTRQHVCQKSQPQLRRVCVQFSDHPPLYYQADAATAWAIAAAFAREADPIVTIDDAVMPGLRPFPCAQLFQAEGKP